MPNHSHGQMILCGLGRRNPQAFPIYGRLSFIVVVRDRVRVRRLADTMQHPSLAEFQNSDSLFKSTAQIHSGESIVCKFLTPSLYANWNQGNGSVSLKARTRCFDRQPARSDAVAGGIS